MTPGAENPALYRTLKDVLERQGEVRSVWYEPDAIQKRFLAAAVDPQRIVPPSGPDAPRVEVHWKLVVPHDVFRIDYADPNLPFHCGWHRDDDHNDIGETHFQYTTPAMETPQYEQVTFEAEAPAKLLWECCEELFANVIPVYTAEL